VTQIYLQITTDIVGGFNCRDLIRFMEHSLDLSDGVLFGRVKTSGLALQIFTRLDQNKDGRVCLADLGSTRQRLLKGLAPTPSTDPVIIETAASQRFQSLTPSDYLDYNQLLVLMKERLPKPIPLRGMIAEAGVLTLLEALAGESNLPIRERRITEEMWIRAALELCA